MHFKTGHSDVMPRVGNLPAHMIGPQPKAVKAKPVALCSGVLPRRGPGRGLLLPELSLVRETIQIFHVCSVND